MVGDPDRAAREGLCLVLNAGSSSLKFALYPAGEPSGRDVRGEIEDIGGAPRFTARRGGATAESREVGGTVRDARSALDFLLGWTDASHPGPIAAVGHRIVHGGPSRSGPALVTVGLLAELRALTPLAPLHQPRGLEGIAAVSERLPDVPQVACFDTSFHRGRPALADLVPLPEEIRRGGVQRYGFHGLSYEYIASALARIAPQIARGRVIVAHLGNGASLCALRAGRSVDTTMGFTALDGLCMGTRPGSLDPGVVLHLVQQMGLSPRDVEDLLYRRSGLLGVSGESADMRELLASDSPGARLAVDYFVYRAAKEIGALAAVLGGLDGVVFTAGIGENSAAIRARVCEASAWLGVDLDPEANASHGPRISRPDGRVSAWVIPTDEEIMIARHTRALLGLSSLD